LVDIDFDACHIQMLYREKKKPAPENPYVFKKGDDDDKRNIAKKLLLTTLNYKRGDKETPGQVWRRVIYASEVEADYHSDYDTVKGILFELEELHAPIKEDFYSGKGLSLQNKEAEIMRKIMKSCINKDIPILPCHDGCSVKASDAIRVKEIFDSVTPLPATPEPLIGDPDKVKKKIEEWLYWNPCDKRHGDIKVEYKQIIGTE